MKYGPCFGKVSAFRCQPDHNNPGQEKTSLQDNPLGNSEVKTKAELGSLKPSEMIPDNLPDGATDSN